MICKWLITYSTVIATYLANDKAFIVIRRVKIISSLFLTKEKNIIYFSLNFHQTFINRKLHVNFKEEKWKFSIYSYGEIHSLLATVIIAIHKSHSHFLFFSLLKIILVYVSLKPSFKVAYKLNTRIWKK